MWKPRLTEATIDNVTVDNPTVGKVATLLHVKRAVLVEAMLLCSVPACSELSFNINGHDVRMR